MKAGYWCLAALFAACVLAGHASAQDQVTQKAIQQPDANALNEQNDMSEMIADKVAIGDRTDPKAAVEAAKEDQTETKDDTAPQSQGREGGDANRQGLPSLSEKYYEAPISNADGVAHAKENYDLRDKDRDAGNSKEAKAAINGRPVDADAATDDAEEEDEEDEDKDADNEQRAERVASATLNLDNTAEANVERKDLPNIQRPDWPLALKATPRLPVAENDLARLALPEDCVFNFDWRGHFKERMGLRFPHMDAFDTPDWTITFWIKLSNETSSGKKGWHSIINKGHNSHDRQPGIWLSDTNRLWVRLYTSHHDDEGFHSKFVLKPDETTHVAIVRRGRTFVMYINGGLDTHMVTVGRVLANDGPLHISRTPGYLGFNGELFGLRWFRRGLIHSEITREASVGTERPVLGLDNRKLFTNDDLDVANIPHDKAMDTADFTVALWFQADQDSTSVYRNIFHKGDDKSLTPSCFLMPTVRRLSCHITTTDAQDEHIESRSLIPLHTPTHIALVRRGNSLELYIDGQRDAQVYTKGLTKHNAFHLNIGSSKWALDGQTYSSGAVGRVPYFRWFSRAFDVVEVRTDMANTAPKPVLAIDNRATYEGEDRIVVPHRDALRSQGATVQFWVSIDAAEPLPADKEEPHHEWAVLFRKGASAQEYSPSLWYKRSKKASQLQVRVSTAHNLRESFDSQGTVRVGTPTHVALVLEGKVIRLYINGKEDSVFTMRGIPVLNYGPVYIGSTPWDWGFKGQIQDFEWFSRPLLQHELRVVSPHQKYRFYSNKLNQGPLVEISTPVEFNGFSMLSLPDRNLRATSTSVTFWLELGENPRATTRVIFRKGDEKSHQTPALYLTTEGRLRVACSVGSYEHATEEWVDSSKVIPAGSPNHIAVVQDKNDLKLYINGVLDTFTTFTKPTVLNGGRFHIGKDLFHGGLVGKVWNFNVYGHVLTENNIRQIASGASRVPALDLRYNGAFTGHDLIEVPGTTDLSSHEMSISLWVTLRGNPTGTWRTIVHKGDSNAQRTPTLRLRPHTNNIEAVVTTTREAAESVTTTHVLQPGVPTHIVYVLKDRRHEIYINGIKDVSEELFGEAVFNDGPLMIGKDLWHDGFVGSIKAVQLFSRALSEQEVLEFPADIHVPTTLSVELQGKFHGRDQMVVPHNPVFDAPEYSMMFWLTLLGPQLPEWTTIVHKGEVNADRAPGVFLYPYEPKIYVGLSTTKDKNNGFTPKYSFERGVPTHVAIVVTRDRLKVFINGQDHGAIVLQDPIATNTGPLYIGKDPWYKGTDGAINGFRIIPSALDGVAVQQEMAKDRRF
eukprot:TRINITY_DN3537_c0_g2_i1.p1 TRINITY_DN3537_c0_g2~~TRINITY_DN3537_c0_g2_i1.p1  ORF type:complete len:1305 (+),score=471.12 TRINITY_DN3537_c0_g2_i1:68-3982(+)